MGLITNMHSTISINDKRKFHDAWAFILYLIVTIGCTYFTIINIKEKKININFTFEEYKLFISSFIIVCVFLFLNFFCLRFLPEFYLKFTIILYPLILLFKLFLTNLTSSSIIASTLAILFWAFFIIKYWKTLSLISSIIKSAVSILISRLFSVTISVIICFVFLCLQFILFGMSFLLKIDNKSLILTLLFFNFYWSVTNIIYFYKVYITSLIAFHLIESEDSNFTIFYKSLKNSFCAFGSISFAGLLIAIIETLRFIVNDERDENDRERKSNAFKRILLCITSILLSIMQNFIKMANEITLPYIAIHGTGYVKSMKNSFELLQKGDIKPFTGTIVINFMLFFMFMITSVCCVIVSILLMDKISEKILNVLIISAIPLLFYFIWTIVFSASYLSIIYLFADRPLLFKEIDKKLYDNLQCLRSL